MVEQYEVYWVELDPTRGGEMAKTRPCVVVTPSDLNMYLTTVVIVPITSTIRNYPYRVLCSVAGREGEIATDQIRNIMVTNIIQIGNSKGIILPSEVLKQLRLSLKSAVSISLDGNNIVIKAQPRQGWAEAAKRAHENGDDELLIPDVFEDEKFEDWTW
ncbi:hypothetical protein GAO41_30245 [Bacteroides thetaiotaomicron]|nr:hypothetical protein GAO41_30245 [Bacteroides thetaiotaomicron]